MTSIVKTVMTVITTTTTLSHLQEENEKYTRVSVIPLNAVTDYDYFSTCLYRSLHAILPTNLVKQKHQLVDVPTLPLYDP